MIDRLTDSNARIFQAARTVAARRGVRGLTIAAIAAEARRAQGTVGRFGIEAFIAHVVEAAFTPLIAHFERRDIEPSPDLHDAHAFAEIALLRDRDAASLVVQAHALAASDPSLAERLRKARLAAEIAVAARLSHTHAGADLARRIVDAYLVKAISTVSS